MWDDLLPVGRDQSTGGYRRFAWTKADSTLREWFSGEASARGLDLTVDRAGNQWAWWGNPDETPGVVLGSHLDSVPDGGAFDGPLGVVSAFAALDAFRASGRAPARPIGIVNFADEEGARFGVACAGSRLITGALAPDKALALRDTDGVTLGEAIGVDTQHLGRDEQTLRRVGVFVELHIEQGRWLIDYEYAVGVGDAIWPHGRWRVDLPGEANHAGTTALEDRRDPMLALAGLIQQARAAAERHDALATCGKLRVAPNAVNAVPSEVTAWIDARATDEERVRGVVEELRGFADAAGGRLVEESWTPTTAFDEDLVNRVATQLDAPRLGTGAGHDAGILASAGIPSAMLFVRNPTGISHSPAEFATEDDCLAGVKALADVLDGLV
jgi:N-carbamoyl-L-amino-acid hydrolase